MYRRWFSRPILGVALVAFGASGCTMRVPAEDLDFSPEERVVLAFDDGTRVVGRVDNNESVRYVTGEHTLRGVVESVDEQEIVVGQLVTISEHGSATYERERLRHFRLYVEDDDKDRLILSRDRILGVERIVPDNLRTFRQILFWSFAAGIGVLAARDRNF